MTYKLALALKDAGLRQTGKGEIQSSDPMCLHNKCDCKSIYIPTLEELIDACGGAIGYLKPVRDISDMNTILGWETFKAEFPEDAMKKREFIRGKTLLEIVAKLFIELNKK